MTIVKGRTT